MPPPKPNAEELFHAALERSPGARDAYLTAACEGDGELRHRVEELIAAHAAVGAFLQEPAVPPAPFAGDPVQEGPGSRIGPYRLLERLGEGGFGVVYRAQQSEPVRREVALKIIKLGMDTAQVIARFEAERQALALTEHPNIARVLDAGATETGRPYFVMELVRGMALCDYCDRHRLSLVGRLELFVEVCRAVQHAHQKGIIHRDLKPSNVLVAMQDGRAVPKVIDFGVAKATTQRLTARTLHTEMGQLIGTPVYMSPEQAERSGLDVDTRADIYSLGAMLYELLTGATPFDSRRLREASLVEVQRILRDEEPPAPSVRVQRMGAERRELALRRRVDPATFAGRLSGDLDWIVAKAIDKDRTRRYESADGLAADVLRHLGSEPVLAGPPGALYRVTKFVRRNRVGVLAGSMVALALVAGATLAVTFLLQALDERDTAKATAAFWQDLIDLEQAKRPVPEVIARTRAAFGDDHAAVATALTAGGRMRRECGDLGGAQALYKAALDTWRALHGEAHVNVALAHGRLGALLLDRDEPDAAHDHLVTAVRIGEAQPGAPSPALCEVREHLASLLGRRGDFAGAARELRLAADARRGAFPEQHDVLGRTLEALARVLASDGDFSASAAARREAIAELELAYPDSVLTAERRLEFGAWLKGVGNARDAELHLREGVRIHRAHPGLESEAYLAGLTALQKIVRERAGAEDEPSAGILLDESDQLLEEAIAIARKLYGPDSLELADHLVRRAEALAERDRSVEAAALQKEAYDIRERVLGDAFQPATMLFAMNNLAISIALREDATSEAYELAAEVTDLMLQRDPGASQLHDLKGALLMRMRKYQEARAALERSRALADSTGGASTRPAHLALAAIVAHHLGQGLLAEAYLGSAREHAGRSTFASDPVVEALLSEAASLLRERQSR